MKSVNTSLMEQMNSKISKEKYLAPMMSFKTFYNYQRLSLAILNIKEKQNHKKTVNKNV
jgi:hypothetical protein